MIISLCALVLSTAMCLGIFGRSAIVVGILVLNRCTGIRQHLIRRNKRSDDDERIAMQGANDFRVKEAALLEGITFDQAMERRKGFRYLY